MSRVFLAGLIIGVLAAPAWAQQETGRPRQPGERRGGPGGGRPAWGGRMFTRVANELDLDEGQRAEFDKIVAAYRERMREQGRRWMEVRQAMRDGDEERAAQLRAELPERGGPGSGMAEVLEEIEPILREDQVATLWEIQDRMQSRQDDWERYRSVVDDLPDELKLDATQREEFDRIMESRRQQMRERGSELRPLFEEMREAGEAGDLERVAELRRQLEEARPDPASMFPGLFEELEGMLNDEQKERLAAFRERLETGGADAGQREPEDVRNVLKAVRRLSLSSEQKSDIREIEREAIGAYRKIGRRNQEEQARLAVEVKKEIVALLDAEQTEQFEQQLNRLERRDRKDRAP
jgi:Spy/CpxP family protein refolding chaperone